MDIEEYIEKIVENGRIEDMESLSDMLEDTMEIIQKYDEDCYNEMKMKLFKMVYGNKLPDEVKVEWVKNMNPVAKWDIQEIKEIHSRYGVQIPLYSFYVIMNMLYSDMRKSLGEVNSEQDLSRYIQGSHDWYYDEDIANTEEAKLASYWEYVVN